MILGRPIQMTIGESKLYWFVTKMKSGKDLPRVDDQCRPEDDNSRNSVRNKRVRGDAPVQKEISA